MKKNWVLRLGLLAMVLTLVTMPMVSSTYAKYVTAANASDTARVAKWGVDITAETIADDELFDLEYDTEDLEYTGDVSVEALTNVVAPGTTGSFVFDITGTPEVAVRVTFLAEPSGDRDNILKNWLITDYLDAVQVYEPINWTVTNEDGHYLKADGSWDVAVTSHKIAGLTAALALIADDYAPLTDLAETYTITWEWPFEVVDNTTIESAAGVFYTYDEADTILGKATTPADIGIKITMTATQIE